ncbi:MAG: hypothetical protein QM682_09855 [Paracoccus sp. (in: a-proteobacteria)]|uniref:hypothetical protein n=1 Tax=Paracoccus sp. TaxID=267 RepID=UPI0039E42222
MAKALELPAGPAIWRMVEADAALLDRVIAGKLPGWLCAVRRVRVEGGLRAANAAWVFGKRRNQEDHQMPGPNS